MVNGFPSAVFPAWEDEDVVVDASRVEAADVDGGPEEGDLDAQTQRREGALVDKRLGMLDGRLGFLLGVEADEIAFGGVADVIDIVVGREGELAGILVTAGIAGIKYLDGLSLVVGAVEGAAIVP